MLFRRTYLGKHLQKMLSDLRRVIVVDSANGLSDLDSHLPSTSCRAFESSMCMVEELYEIIDWLSNCFSSLCKDGRETFSIMAHLETESGIRISFLPVCLACVSSQKAAFCEIPL